MNPRQVLSYLNELGYTNISAQQLKEFMTDLKKLIKYEESQTTLRNEDVYLAQNLNLSRNYYQNAVHLEEIHKQSHNVDYLGHMHLNTQTEQNLQNIEPDYITSSKGRNQRNVFTDLYNTGTVSSRSKQSEVKKQVISVEIHAPPQKLKPNGYNAQYDNENKKVSGSISEHSENHITVVPPINCGLSSPTKSVTTVPSIKRKASKSYIKPKIKPKPIKSDPVALYHYYQSIWKSVKIPGEENHSDLRWAVREKMLGENDVCR